MQGVSYGGAKFEESFNQNDVSFGSEQKIDSFIKQKLLGTERSHRENSSQDRLSPSSNTSIQKMVPRKIKKFKEQRPQRISDYHN